MDLALQLDTPTALREARIDRAERTRFSHSIRAVELPPSPLQEFAEVGCDWVTHASSHFDSRHELIRDMNKRERTSEAHQTLHLDSSYEASGLLSRPDSGKASDQRAPQSAPALYSAEEQNTGIGGDPAFATVPTSVLRNRSSNGFDFQEQGGRPWISQLCTRPMQASSTSTFGTR